MLAAVAVQYAPIATGRRQRMSCRGLTLSRCPSTRKTGPSRPPRAPTSPHRPRPFKPPLPSVPAAATTSREYQGPEQQALSTGTTARAVPARRHHRCAVAHRPPSPRPIRNCGYSLSMQFCIHTALVYYEVYTSVHYSYSRVVLHSNTTVEYEYAIS